MDVKRSICFVTVMICILVPAVGTAEWDRSGNLKVAVLDLLSRVDRENVDVITLTEMLQAALADKKAFQVVERSMLSKILEEQKLSMSGLTESQASKVGALAGAQKIITGSISQMGDRYILIGYTTWRTSVKTCGSRGKTSLSGWSISAAETDAQVFPVP